MFMPEAYLLFQNNAQYIRDCVGPCDVWFAKAYKRAFKCTIDEQWEQIIFTNTYEESKNRKNWMNEITKNNSKKYK